MAEIVKYTCPGCGAELVYDAKTGKLSCGACGSSYEIEEVKQMQESGELGASDMTWVTSEPAIIEEGTGKMMGYSCPSCGAKMLADENTAATVCPYCGNNSIIPQAFEGSYRPDLVVPFSIDKNQARESLEKFYKKKKLLPSAFKTNNHIDEITGVYVPFWLMSCHTHGRVRFNAVKRRQVVEGNTTYRITDSYVLNREADMDFERIPVRASSKMDDKTMESLEPYDVTKAVKYDPVYFSGYLADRYDVTAKDSEKRANERVEQSFMDEVRSTVGMYENATVTNKSIDLSNTKAEFAMLPVWMLSTSYNGEIYKFGINGQTGRTTGKLPVDKGKFFLYMMIAAAICMAVLQVAIYFINEHTFTWKAELIALAASVIVGLAVALVEKGGMNNVSLRAAAGNYLQKNTVKHAPPRDVFLSSKKEAISSPANVPNNS